jgi:hypothetical protein
MGIKFNCTDIYGTKIEIRTPLIDELVEIVSGRKANDRRSLAILILKYVNEQRTASQNKSEFERSVDEMLLNAEVLSLWNLAEDTSGVGLTVRLQTVKDKDGAERLEIKRVWKQESETISRPVTQKQSLEPIVEPVARQEKKYLTFDERFAPAEVARRVAAIEREAAEFRRQREEEDVRRGFSL